MQKMNRFDIELNGSKVMCPLKIILHTITPVDKLTQLTTLYLYQNQLKSLPNGVFDKLTQLKELSLGDNQLNSLPHGVFDKLTQLTHLYLWSNQLKSVPDSHFKSFITNLVYPSQSPLMIYNLYKNLLIIEV